MRALKDLGLDVAKGTVSTEGSIKQTKLYLTRLCVVLLLKFCLLSYWLMWLLQLPWLFQITHLTFWLPASHSFLHCIFYSFTFSFLYSGEYLKLHGWVQFCLLFYFLGALNFFFWSCKLKANLYNSWSTPKTHAWAMLLECSHSFCPLLIWRWKYSPIFGILVLVHVRILIFCCFMLIEDWLYILILYHVRPILQGYSNCALI